MADLIELVVPDIGDFDEVEVIEVLVAVGDTVEENQDIITLESDKAAMEIPSSHAGVIKELKITVGDKVKEGSVIAMIEVSDVAAPKVASEPAEVKLSVPAPGSKSTVPLKEPVVYTLPLASVVIEYP